jgi:hypothetical protein
VRFCILILALNLADAAAATLQGSVQDGSGAAVAGTLVVLGNTADLSLRTAQTDATGRFSFPEVNPGTYALTVRRTGFELYKQVVEVAAAPIVVVDVQLKIEALETAVKVGGKISSLANADHNYQALRAASPVGSYRVGNLVLKRDVGQFTFTQEDTTGATD